MANDEMDEMDEADERDNETDAALVRAEWDSNQDVPE